MFKLGFVKSNGGTPPAPTFVTIGTQKWNTKNLDVVTYRSGTPINYAANSSQWNFYGTNAEGCYASVNFDSANDAQYGLLYNGYAIQNISDGGLAPEGWHIPSYEEINTLITYLGGNPAAVTNSIGGLIKETGTTRWASPNTGATNSTNFTDVGAGTISNVGIYNSFKTTANHALIGNMGIDVPFFQTQHLTNILFTPTMLGSNGALEAGYSVRTIRNDSLIAGTLYGGGKIVLTEGDPFTAGFSVIVVLDDLSFIDSYGCTGTTIGALGDGDFVPNTDAMNSYNCNLVATYLRTPNNVQGYNDWYIAAKNQAQAVLDENAVSGISPSAQYWTSTEIDNNNAKAFVYNVGAGAWEVTPTQKTTSTSFFIIRQASL